MHWHLAKAALHVLDERAEAEPRQARGEERSRRVEVEEGELLVASKVPADPLVRQGGLEIGKVEVFGVERGRALQVRGAIFFSEEGGALGPGRGHGAEAREARSIARRQEGR